MFSGCCLGHRGRRKDPFGQFFLLKTGKKLRLMCNFIWTFLQPGSPWMLWYHRSVQLVQNLWLPISHPWVFPW